MSLDWHQHLFVKYKNTELLFKDGNNINISASQSKQIRTWAIKHTYLKNETRPFYLFNGSHNINFNNVPAYNNSAFFFFEPLTYYSNNRKGYADHILRFDNPSGVKSYELDDVSKFVKHNNITCTVYLPDRFAAEYFSTVYNLNFDYYDPYYHAEAHRLNTIGKYLPHWYYTSKIKKALWCGSWRYDPVRHYIIAGLVNNDVHLNNNFSWFYNIETNDIKNVMWTDVPDNVLLGIDKLNNIGPLTMDTKVKSSVSYKNFYPPMHQKTKDPAKQYQECFCALVIETRVAQPWVNLSEKTLHAVKNKRPFLLYAAPRSLETLHEAGLKTFNDYWSEEYDTIVDTKERIAAINKIAYRLNKLNIYELKYMYNDMKHILDHNIQVINKIHRLC